MNIAGLVYVALPAVFGGRPYGGAPEYGFVYVAAAFGCICRPLLRCWNGGMLGTAGILGAPLKAGEALYAARWFMAEPGPERAVLGGGGSGGICGGWFMEEGRAGGAKAGDPARIWGGGWGGAFIGWCG